MSENYSRIAIKTSMNIISCFIGICEQNFWI